MGKLKNLLQSRFYYGTQKYLITFYEGEYPDIDPNVTYSDGELLKEGLTMKPIGNNSYIEDETRHYFGIPINVVTQDYDYDKIQRVCGFKKLPRIETASRKEITFTDGRDSYTMGKHESVHFLKKEDEIIRKIFTGYENKVIMAAGCFVQGSSIELSADGPVRPPYAVYFQGGLTWYHAKLGILMSLQQLVDAKLVTL